ncbi:hypothetical protein Pint_30427 [Pistacia integerrima]|uniref:Uncharacterized protein n=1 Tax=Pistacia integerrima TaxID=434235 RepID=A0ACC0WWW3_9ROSI|nr:hypothetical protein Pint_30427 [Pistacia integerrima]
MGRLVLFEVRHSSFPCMSFTSHMWNFQVNIWTKGIHQESLKKLATLMFFHESVIFLLQQVVVDLEVSAADKD